MATKKTVLKKSTVKKSVTKKSATKKTATKSKVNPRVPSNPVRDTLFAWLYVAGTCSDDIVAIDTNTAAGATALNAMTTTILQALSPNVTMTQDLTNDVTTLVADINANPNTYSPAYTALLTFGRRHWPAGAGGHHPRLDELASSFK